MTDYVPCQVRLGDRVTVGDGIEGVVEELIFARNMVAPFVLVKYWHEGVLVFQRFHAEDCRLIGGGA